MTNAILKLPVLQSTTGLARSTVYAFISQGLLTKPVKIGARSVGWPQSEVSAINAARIAGKSDEQIRDLVRKLEAARTNFEVEKEAA